ncbi:cytochrome P450 [Actinomadura sp. ATCC 31491]|uniref:Cytochrome P450 n=1 Tax=Actinomadura luzonensis TaxID=2805427 RepID=A0ABT0FW95_9ACTN|nr:cytochrome P450 [Actinomadura luzonensis]MCK2216163.1 cytochrome P450 [Actinomadura luzonensis]UKU09914.1 Luz26 [Actinomadura luzonensis]
MTTTSAQWDTDERQFWLRGEQPPAWVDFDEAIGVWRVFGYPEALRAFTEIDTFSSNTERLAPMEVQYTEGNLVEMDPPQHGKLRKLVTHAFTPRMVANLEPRVREITNELLDATGGAGRIELINDLAYPLPVIVICELLGIPADDRHLFKRWVDEMMAQTHEYSFSEPTELQESSMQHAMEQMGRLVDYICEHAEDRRRTPREDLLSSLVHAEVDGRRMSNNEVAIFANSLLVNGHLTTTMLLGNSVLCLDAHPEQFAEVRADRSKIPGAIEEALRFVTPAPVLGRATLRETELGGRVIPADQIIQVWVGAANRDPRQFERPDVYDLHRDPNPHLTFGRGIHFCVGAGLARLESRVVMDLLLDRYRSVRSDPDEPPAFLTNPYVTALRSFPLLVA